MGVAEASPILETLAPLAGAVPLAGPVLEGLLGVAVQVCQAVEVRPIWEQTSIQLKITGTVDKEAAICESSELAQRTTGARRCANLTVCQTEAIFYFGKAYAKTKFEEENNFRCNPMPRMNAVFYLTA